MVGFHCPRTRGIASSLVSVAASIVLAGFLVAGDFSVADKFSCHFFLRQKGLASLAGAVSVIAGFGGPLFFPFFRFCAFPP